MRQFGILTKSNTRPNNFKQITSPDRKERGKIETVAKAIILCIIAISGAAGAITYLYDPAFFKYSLEGNSVSNSQNYSTETVNHLKLSRYKKRLLEESRVETQPPENTNPDPEQLWTDTYDKPRSSEYYPLQKAKKLADNNSPNVLKEKMDYWYNRYQEALQSGPARELNYAYTQYENYKEALEIKRGSL